MDYPVDSWEYDYIRQYTNFSNNQKLKLNDPILKLILLSKKTSTIYFNLDGKYLFKLIYNNEILIKFIADFGDGCNNLKLCYWSAGMKKFLNNNKTIGLTAMLSYAIKTYKDLQFHQDEIAMMKLEPQKDRSFLTKMAEYANNSIESGYNIVGYEENKWIVKFSTSQSEIVDVLFEFPINFPHDIPIIRVLEPRLRLNKGISFGGTFETDGLTNLTWNKKKKDLLPNVEKVIFQVLRDDTYEDMLYNSLEYNACMNKQILKIKKQSVNFLCNVNDDVKYNNIILPKKYSRSIHNDIVSVITNLGIIGYFIPIFSDVDDAEISKINMINLSLKNNDEIYINVNESIKLAKFITLRPRSEDFDRVFNYQEDKIEEIEKLLLNYKVVTIGHTIEFIYENMKYYIDVIDANEKVISFESEMQFLTIELKFEKSLVRNEK